jgi:hypothetical protein
MDVGRIVVDHSRADSRVRASKREGEISSTGDISPSFPKVAVEAKLSVRLTNVGAARPSESPRRSRLLLAAEESTVGVNGLILMTRSGNANARGNTIFKEPISRTGERRGDVQTLTSGVFDSPFARGLKSRGLAIFVVIGRLSRA